MTWRSAETRFVAISVPILPRPITPISSVMVCFLMDSIGPHLRHHRCARLKIVSQPRAAIKLAFKRVKSFLIAAADREGCNARSSGLPGDGQRRVRTASGCVRYEPIGNKCATPGHVEVASH